MSEHKEIKSALMEIHNGINDLRSEKDEVKPFKQIKSGLSQIDVIWHPHIQIEEAQLYKQVGSLKINSKEMIRIIKEVSEFFQAHTGPPYLIVPFALFNLSPEDRAILAKDFQKK